MGTIAAIAHLALKLGLPAIAIISAEWGPLVAAVAFFALMPLGHLVLGVALLIFGALVPKLPGDDTKQMINVGAPQYRIAIKGNARTALLAGALVIIIGSLGEAIASVVRGQVSG